MTFLQAVFQRALEFGADGVGVVQAGDAETFPYFCDWLKQGNQASMSYLEKNKEARKNPCSILSNVQSMIIIVVSMAKIAEATQNFCSENITSGTMNHLDEDQNSSFNHSIFLDDKQFSGSKEIGENWGTILFYGGQFDYHNVVRQKLILLKDWILSLIPKTDIRIVVDTAPLLEKEWARRAGLGFIGRNSLLIHPKLGSRLFLGTLLLSLSLDEMRLMKVPDELFQKKEFALDFLRDNIESDQSEKPLFSTELNLDCGKCRRCLECCPTGAILENKTLDARRCLNYWTIEHKKDDIPQFIREKLGNRLFGCDLCQQVCPWNHFEQKWQPFFIDLSKIQTMSDSEFKRFFDKTPVSRIKCNGLKRNAQWLE